MNCLRMSIWIEQNQHEIKVHDRRDSMKLNDVTAATLHEIIINQKNNIPNDLTSRLFEYYIGTNGK